MKRATIAALLHATSAYAGLWLHSTSTDGCGKALAKGVQQGGTGESNNITIKSNHLERNYLLHVPTHYNENEPVGLIFSFHGRGSNASTQEELSEFSNYNFNPEMLAVYPQGIDDEWQGDPDATTDDVTFTLDMIDSLSNDYCIDTNKIFASGKSNGGGFSVNILACDPVASRKIAAYFSASGAYYQGDGDGDCKPDTVPVTCTPGRLPIPIMETHGGEDQVIPYEGGDRRGACLSSVPHFMTAWAELDSLASTNVSVELFDGNVSHYTFGRRWLDGLVQSYYIPDMGHQWPSTEPNPDSIMHMASPTYFNATPLVMEFFGNWTLDKAEFWKWMV